MTRTESREPDTSWKTKFFVIGAVGGALAGLGTAYLLVRTAEENSAGPPQVSTSDVLRIGVNLIGMMRGIAALGGGR